ncbi:MAG TPA: ATP synthase F0 subunit B [Holophagaceae bacterium]|nr:ATP synthase F0 subunit B [Holophagaceae bacterium]
MAKIIAQMPDPMKPALPEIGYVIVLVTVLYLLLKVVFFKPITEVMETRERDMNAGSDTKAKAAALVEARQKEYQDRLKELRAKAFAHRKALAEAAAKEKQALLEEARAKAGAQRQSALDALKAESAKAKQDLVAQVDALAESMAQHLMKQA